MENTFGKRLKEIRKIRNKSQEWLAEQCDTSVSSIARWEADTLRPNKEHQKKLAEALEVTVDDFYVNPELPLPKNILLAEILETVKELDQPFQMHILETARSLIELTRHSTV